MEITREPHKDDFQVEVEGVGSFTFGRRQMRDEFRIQAEYSRLTEGVTPGMWLFQIATAVATIQVLAVEAPENFDIEDMDPQDEETWENIFSVYNALREKEKFFREGPGKGRQKKGQKDGGDRRPVVQEDVQTPAK